MRQSEKQGQTGQEERIAELFSSVLEYALPGVKWSYRGSVYESGESAKRFMPLFARQALLWERELADYGMWGFREGMRLGQDKEEPCGLSIVISPDVCAGPLLLFMLEAAMMAAEMAVAGGGGVINLNILDRPIGMVGKMLGVQK